MGGIAGGHSSSIKNVAALQERGRSRLHWGQRIVDNFVALDDNSGDA
jgi:hypothetical protein